MTIGLDTNVLLRALLNDNREQSDIAQQLLATLEDNKEKCFLPNLVLCELAWTLRSSFKRSRAETIEVLESLLETEVFEFENRSAVVAAVQQMAVGQADFADYLMGVLSQQAGCRETVTFDRQLDGEGGWRLLTS